MSINLIYGMHNVCVYALGGGMQFYFLPASHVVPRSLVTTLLLLFFLASLCLKLASQLAGNGLLLQPFFCVNISSSGWPRCRQAGRSSCGFSRSCCICGYIGSSQFLCTGRSRLHKTEVRTRCLPSSLGGAGRSQGSGRSNSHRAWPRGRCCRHDVRSGGRRFDCIASSKVLLAAKIYYSWLSHFYVKIPQVIPVGYRRAWIAEIFFRAP